MKMPKMPKIKLWSNAPGNIIMMVILVALVILVIWGLVWGFGSKETYKAMQNRDDDDDVYIEGFRNKKKRY
jgi:uncharacterized membrane protein